MLKKVFTVFCGVCFVIYASLTVLYTRATSGTTSLLPRHRCYVHRQFSNTGVLTGTGTIIGHRYHYQHKLDHGYHGNVFIGTDTLTNEKVAVKINKNRVHFKSDSEGPILQALQGGEGIPVLKWFGNVGRKNTGVVTELLGPSLFDIVKEQPLHMRTALLIAYQLLSRLEYIHSKGYLHRDAKPNNFVTGVGGKCNTIYVLDFALSSSYLINGTGQHVPYAAGAGLRKRCIFCSLERNRGNKESRRDDLESVGYTLIYVLRKKLPWYDSQLKNNKHVCAIKYNTSLHDLCGGLPSEFLTYMEYVRGLEFTETPDYSFLRKLFTDVFNRYGFSGSVLNQELAFIANMNATWTEANPT